MTDILIPTPARTAAAPARAPNTNNHRADTSTNTVGAVDNHVGISCIIADRPAIIAPEAQADAPVMAIAPLPAERESPVEQIVKPAVNPQENIFEERSGWGLELINF
jgi:hypothetical protein